MSKRKPKNIKPSACLHTICGRRVVVTQDILWDLELRVEEVLEGQR